MTDAHRTTEWKSYERKGHIEAAPWVPGFDMTMVSLSQADQGAGHPKEGGMIARNKDVHDDMWYIAQDFFETHYAPRSAPEPAASTTNSVSASSKSASPGEPSAEQAPIARINVENNGLIEVATVMHLYAPGLPPGEHDLYCEAGADPVRLAADELVAHIGAVGEIDSRHRLVLNCLEALNSTGLPRAPEPAGKYANMRRDELEDSIDELAASVERGRSIIEALRSFIEPSDPEISVVELDWAQEADDYLAGKSPPTKRDGE